MDVTISLNKGALEGSKGFVGSGMLCEAFLNRGHNLQVISPDDIYNSNKGFKTKKSYRFIEVSKPFNLNNQDSLLEGDVFFVYGLGEDSPKKEVSEKFMKFLYGLELQYNHMLNSAEATSYENKKKQNNFLAQRDFHLMPTFNVKSVKDLERLISSGEKIIAKPHVGFLGRGIKYIACFEDINSLETIKNYTFQRFVPANEERRYLFLDGKLIIRRSVERIGTPGREVYGGINLIEGYPNEEEIAKKIIKTINMFYGAVDFRGKLPQSYVLEVNGSGTGVAPPDEKNTRDCYNISSLIVKAVEEKLKRGL